jgi:hypothetical protein
MVNRCLQVSWSSNRDAFDVSSCVVADRLLFFSWAVTVRPESWSETNPAGGGAADEKFITNNITATRSIILAFSLTDAKHIICDLKNKLIS